MPALSIILDGDGAWPDLPHKDMVEGELTAVAPLAGGMESGKPSVTFRIDLPISESRGKGPQTVVLAQTSLALFLSAADAFKARYGDPRT